jgi:hypothetical protein
MDIEGLQAWGEVHHYPQLVLGRDVLRAGERAFQRFLRQASSERIEQAMRRVEQWTADAQRELITQA